MSRRVVKLKAESARLWLESTLKAGPMPAREVYRLAALEGIPVKGLKRAKRYHTVKSVKTGGLFPDNSLSGQFQIAQEAI